MPAEVASSHRPASDQPSTGSSDDYVRLHITPLDSKLCKIIIPAAVQPVARNISYHTLETFPEKRYGFVELPQVDADKLKNKLNGATLKGSKVRIETARPEDRMEPTGDVGTAEKKRKKSKDDTERPKKRKRDPDVMEGVTLQDRKVKRGWTESVDTKIKNKRSKDKDSKSKDKDGKDKDGKDKEKGKRKRLKSKYTDQEECLLKVKVPPNAVGNLPEADAPKRRKKKGKSREVTVHEFAKTTKFPSFLKSTASETSGNPATEFVDGKGWVDEEGNVVEEVKMNPKMALPKRKEKAKPKVTVEESDDSTSSSGTSSEEDDEEEESDAKDSANELGKQSDSEDEDESSEEDEPSPPGENATTLSAIKALSSRPMSSSSSKSLTIKIPPPATPSVTKVHPLEALYKRQKPEPTATETPAEPEPFSFFGTADDDEEEEEDADQPAAAVPMTPYTRQDMEYRNVRSAAPTPDTAHPSRMKNFWAPQDDDDNDNDDDDDDEMGDAADAAGEEEAPPQEQQEKSGDFQTWFWDNRRELNRSWMTRRKTAAKEKRHRENKARASKAI
ncbi:hypothetical protein TOPH_04696 [Tolypocladium ophioglossoides CBS 100239]|uniref:Suppressor protein SRP40 n=1 Tax=Tolypocladium ophioglossoides (strain CBS 100239) TaxID=1163406 RepID=A0A0L0N996_TOLOC|nr:hypothetical protein TOPH_04696 [Tolypocladium ophioglossoides CBS 100239]